MVVLVVAGMKGLPRVVAIASVIAVETLTKHGVGLARLTGAELIALAVWEGTR